MKLIFVLIFAIVSLSASASHVEVMQFSILDNEQTDLLRYRPVCMQHAYDLETESMIKTGDSQVKVRMSRLDSHPAGVFYCYVSFFSTDKTTFVKETQSFNIKKCENKEKEIAGSEGVVWTRSSNRVKLPNGVKGCEVELVRGIAN